MTIELSTMLVSTACLAAALVWGLLYWRLVAPRSRQWLRYSLLIGLGWAMLAMWLIDTKYSLRTGWLGDLGSRLELWLLLGLCISLLAVVWLYLPTARVLSRAVKVNYARLGLSALVIVVGGLVAALLNGPVLITLVAIVGLLGLWRASSNQKYLLSSAICLAIAAVLGLLIGFGIPWLWPNTAGFQIGPWWSMFDLSSLVLIIVVAWGVGSLSWWWLGQSTD